MMEPSTIPELKNLVKRCSELQDHFRHFSDSLMHAFEDDPGYGITIQNFNDTSLALSVLISKAVGKLKIVFGRDNTPFGVVEFFTYKNDELETEPFYKITIDLAGVVRRSEEMNYVVGNVTEGFELMQEVGLELMKKYFARLETLR